MFQAEQDLSILFVNSHPPESYGGGERWYVLMAEWFHSKGYRIFLLCRPHSTLIPHFERLNATIFPFNFSFDFNPFSAYRVYRIIKSHRILFLICNFNKDVSIAGMAGRWAGVKKIVFRNGYELLHNKWKHKLLLPFFDTIIANNQYLKDRYSGFNWGLENRCEVIYNGVRIEEFTPILKKKQLFILGAGRLTDIKNYRFFIDLMARLKAEGIDYVAAIAGEGDERPVLSQLIAEKQVNVELLGHLQNLHPYYQIADIFCHPSSNEGLPTVIVEAMAHGCPSVTFRVGGTGEIVTHEQNGLIYSWGDNEGFYQGLKSLCLSQETRAFLAQNAQRFYHNHFDFDKCYQAVEKLLHN